MTRAGRLRIPVLLAVGLVLVVALAAPAAARPGRAAAKQPAALTLVAQPAWSRPGDDVLLRVAVRGTVDPAAEVSAHIHTAVTSRFAFEQTVNGDRLGGTVATRTAKLADLPLVGDERVFTIPLQDPAAPRDPNRVLLRVDGAGSVYPVELELRDPDSSTVLDGFVTDLLLVPRTPAAGTDARLQVGWMWRLAAAPSTTTAGEPDPSFVADTGPGGRLTRIVNSLQTASIPLTLVPNPETVEAIVADPASKQLADRLRAVAPTVGILAGPYTTIDGPSLVAGRLTEALTSQLVDGRNVLERDLDAAVDHTVAAPQPLDAPWLGRLRDDAGTTRVVVGPGQLASATPADQFTPARPFRLETGIGGFDALEVNEITSSLLVKPGSDALRAQQVLAALAVIALEQPNRVRGVVIDTPLVWHIRPARASALVAGLRDSPLLKPTEISAIFDNVVASTTSSGRPYARTLAPITPPTAPVGPGEYAAAQNRIDALASMTGSSDPLVGRLRHELLVTPASRTRGTGRRQSRARLDTIQNQVGAVISGIQAPASRTFRLTSRRATVPVSIQNRSDQPLRITVRLESKKLEFPNGSSQTAVVPAGGRNKTLQFDVAARASGTFPVLVTLSSPDGRLDLQRSRYTVRSSVVSGVGLVLTLGAAVFLAAWWFLHWRRRRTPRGGAPATAAPAAS